MNRSERSSEHDSGSPSRGEPKRTRRDNDSAGKVRLQRVMADTGIAARRVCEQLIEEGHVTVNGAKVTKLPVFVDPENDDIRVDGRPIPKPERPMYVMVHKPARVMVTTSGEAGDTRSTIVDLIDHPARTRLFPIGRLDYDTTGLVLLTNDGDLAHKLTHPRYEIPKTYLAMVKGVPDAIVVADLNKKLRKADELEARQKFGRRARIEVVTEVAMRGRSRPRVRLLKTEMKEGVQRSLVEIVLFESRNGQIEELLRLLGCPVKKLVRVAYGPVVLRTLAPGKWRELTQPEITALRKAASGHGPKAPESVLDETEVAQPADAGSPKVSAESAGPEARRPDSTGRGVRPAQTRTRPRVAGPRRGAAKPEPPWGWQLASRARNSRGQRERDLRRAGKLPPIGGGASGGENGGQRDGESAGESDGETANRTGRRFGPPRARERGAGRPKSSFGESKDRAGKRLGNQFGSQAQGERGERPMKSGPARAPGRGGPGKSPRTGGGKGQGFDRPSPGRPNPGRPNPGRPNPGRSSPGRSSSGRPGGMRRERGKPE
jgi:23S rRNA pseudouridine2605 synthase